MEKHYQLEVIGRLVECVDATNAHQTVPYLIISHILDKRSPVFAYHQDFFTNPAIYIRLQTSLTVHILDAHLDKLRENMGV